MALPSTKLEQVTKVFRYKIFLRQTDPSSHPQALAQCDDFTRKRGYIPEVFEDTAGTILVLS